PLQIVLERKVARSEVPDDHRDEERGETTRSPLEVVTVLVLDLDEAADADSDDGADALRHLFRKIEARVLERFLARDERELDEAIHFLEVLRVEVALGLVVGNFPRDARGE